MSETPTPGGEMAGWQQYAPRIDADNKMIGYTDPDGVYHKLDEGAELAFVKSPSGEGREPFIKDQDGKLTPLNPSVASGEQPAATADGGIPINRDALNGIVRETTLKGAVFGVDYDLDDGGREQVRLVADAAEQIIEEKKQDPLWVELQDTINTLAGKGEIMSLDLMGG